MLSPGDRGTLLAASDGVITKLRVMELGLGLVVVPVATELAPELLIVIVAEQSIFTA
jgi:hypothetical protein